LIQEAVHSQESLTRAENDYPPQLCLASDDRQPVWPTWAKLATAVAVITLATWTAASILN